MPELRDLLEGAVDHPAPLDMGDLADRVAHRRRRHRVATLAAGLLVVGLLAGALAVAARAGHEGDDVDIVPPEDQPTTAPSTTTPTTSATTATPSTSATSSPGSGAALPACTADDIDVAPNGDGATAQMVILLAIQPRVAGRSCTIDTTATVTLRDATTDEPLAIDGNPLTVQLSGTVDGAESDVVRSNMIWGGCPADFDANHATIEVVVDGFGTYRGDTPPPGMCADSTGGVFSKTPR